MEARGCGERVRGIIILKIVQRHTMGVSGKAVACWEVVVRIGGEG